MKSAGRLPFGSGIGSKCQMPDEVGEVMPGRETEAPVGVPLSYPSSCSCLAPNGCSARGPRGVERYVGQLLYRNPYYNLHTQGWVWHVPLGDQTQFGLHIFPPTSPTSTTTQPHQHTEHRTQALQKRGAGRKEGRNGDISSRRGVARAKNQASNLH